MTYEQIVLEIFVVVVVVLLEKGLNVNSEKIKERIQDLTTITAKYNQLKWIRFHRFLSDEHFPSGSLRH